MNLKIIKNFFVHMKNDNGLSGVYKDFKQARKLVAIIFSSIFVGSLLFLIIVYPPSSENTFGELHNTGDYPSIIIIIIIIFAILFCAFLFFITLTSSNPFKKFICPICLKAVFIDEIEFTCPFCGKKYGTLINSEGKEFQSANKNSSLFSSCSKCKGAIQYIECPKCKEPIDLFSPYDEKTLEAKRYE